MSFALRWQYLLLSVYGGCSRSSSNERDRRRILRRRRLAADAFSLTDREFVKTYRLTKPLVRALIDELSPILPKPRRRDGMDSPSKIMITLAFLASGSYQTLVGQSISHAVSQLTVSRAVKQVVKALNHEQIFKKHVFFPLTLQAREKIRSGFYTKFGVPGVVGCVDGTHVALIKPAEHEEAYYCRKGYHSLNVMIICDSDLNIICVDPSSPGSTHDSSVWRDHPLNNYLDTINEDGETNFLLGDSGYPLRRNVMTPILNAEEGSPEHFYYNKQVKARNVVERSIGVLKARFRCLLVARQLHYKPEMAAKIVNACCVLHNIANHARLQVPELSEQERFEERQRQLQQRHREATLGPAAAAAAAAAGLTARAPARRLNTPLAQGRAVQQNLIENLWANRDHN